MSTSSDWQIPFSGAEIYETIFVPAMMAEWAPKTVALANPQPGERVLDVACGTGVLTRLVAFSIVPNGQVVGLDLNPEMLAVARKTTINPSAAAPIGWCEGNVSAMPFENEIFEIVFCCFGLMSFPDRAAALNEMRRVLVYGGRLAISVWGSIDKCPGQTAIRESFERHFGRENAALFYRQHTLDNPDVVRSLITDAGFQDVSVQRSMGSVRLPSPEHLVRSYGAMAEIETDEPTRLKVIDEVTRALQPHTGANGLVYPIEAILASAKN